jgi:hypothetical protein
MDYPKYCGDCARVVVTTKDGRKRKAMFYWNGNKPTFASYGSDISEKVIDWDYRDETGNH